MSEPTILDPSGPVPRRTTCMRCGTPLVQTWRGGICPVHNADFLARLDQLARTHLGIRPPEDLRNRKGMPSRRKP